MSETSNPFSDIEADVYVSPRYFASSIGIGDPALAPLRDLGWDLQHDDLGNAYLTAPDRKVRLGYLPEGDDDGLWRISAYRDGFGPPVWGVCFNDRTPEEFVLAFTRALATAYEQGSEAYLARPVADSPTSSPIVAITALLTQGWQFDSPERGVYTIQSPDGHAGLEWTSGHLDPETELTTRSARWQLWAGRSIDHPVWYATFSTDTPVALLAAVTACVADPAPMPRERENTWSYIEGMAKLTPVIPPRPPSPTPLDVRRAIASKPPAALPAPSVPRWTTSSRPALPGSRR